MLRAPISSQTMKLTVKCNHAPIKTASARSVVCPELPSHVPALCLSLVSLVYFICAIIGDALSFAQGNKEAAEVEVKIEEKSTFLI